MGSKPEDDDIDDNTFLRIVNRIYFVERENYKTQKKKNSEMNKKIRKIIELEVDGIAD
jgi:hypothetical protein